MPVPADRSPLPHQGDPTHVDVPSRLETAYFSSFAVKTELKNQYNKYSPRGYIYSWYVHLQ